MLRKNDKLEKLLAGILNTQADDVLITRGPKCEILFMNAPARRRVRGAERTDQACRGGYALGFPGLCDKCPNNASARIALPCAFEQEDENGRLHQISINAVEWTDGKEAVLLNLRDVEDMRAAQERLYNLAYVDQLTGVPNRQKFREDFDALSARVNDGEFRGALALFDLDYFKNINDTYGHSAGDMMLRRLADHLNSNPKYHGRLYRLGGDEFILLFAEDAGEHPSDGDLRAYYADYLSEAFLSYSLPNIEGACTISMGVSLFPLHGSSSSELLRKADIALYQAKESGRNKLVYFEDQYDTAKKFKDLYINIQPILNHNGRTFGYELMEDVAEDALEPPEVNLADFDRTLDALGLDDIQSAARYFIAYNNQLLNDAVLNNLPKDKFIIQIKASMAANDAELTRYRRIKECGYSLALMDYRAAAPEWLTLCDYCKIAPQSMNEFTQKALISDNPQRIFIATGIDSQSALRNAQRLGYKLFQGFFFNQPAVVKKTKSVDPLRVNYLRLLKLCATDDFVDFREISGIISSDVALSYKLLRLLNSAGMGLRYKISSIDMAVAYLGEEQLKKWVALLALRGTGSDKPLEIVRISLIRAQFGEYLAPHFVPRRNAKHIFLLGLFSLLHIALEKSQKEVFDGMPVADEIRDSLLTKTGPYSDLMAFYTSYEYANWDEVNRFAVENDLSGQLINDSYLDAVKWYNNLADA